MNIYRNEQEWIENCRHCKIPMYSVKVENNEVLTGIPNTVLLDPKPKDFDIWEKNPCVDTRTDVWWCPKCYKVFAKALGLHAWCQVGLILEVVGASMKYRHLFHFQTEAVTTIDFNPLDKEFGKPFAESTKCPKCSTWRQLKIQGSGDTLINWHWCPVCNEGEPMQLGKVTVSPVSSQDIVNG